MMHPIAIPMHLTSYFPSKSCLFDVMLKRDHNTRPYMIWNCAQCCPPFLLINNHKNLQYNMWNDQSAAGSSFSDTTNQFGNVNTVNTSYQLQKSGRRSRTAPIVIRQALRCGADGIKIWGTEIQIVSIVARIRNIHIQSIKITYTIQDITGRMRAIHWVEEDDDQYLPKEQVNDYIQIFGNIKTIKGKKVLMVFKILPVTDVNAIICHYLQCINNRLKMEADSKKDKTATSTMITSNLPSNSMINIGINPTCGLNLNSRQTMVYRLICASTLEQGISKGDMYASLKDHMQLAELEDTLDYMCGEGLIYSTIDEEHFRATDAF